MSDDKRETLKNIVAEALNLGAISDDAKQDDYSEWDSMAYLSIVVAVEDKFNVDITPDNINNFNSIDNILKEIENA